MAQKQGRNERTQEDYPTTAKNTQQMSGSLAFFHLCLVSVHFSGPSLTKMKFYRNFSLVSVPFRGFSNHLRNRRRTHLLCWRRTLLAQGKNEFCASDECFSAGNERVQTSPTHTASYQRLSNRTYLEMIATYRTRYSCPKTGGSYHALVATHFRVRYSNTHMLYTQQRFLLD